MGKKFFAWLLLAGGLLLLFSGSREFIGSWWSQDELAEQLHQPEIQPNTTLTQPPTRPPAPTFQPGDVVASLSIPRLKTDLYVVEGLGKKELRRGPGHMIGTALPGESDNMIIGGHRDTHFRILKDIRAGDDIVFAYEGENFTYRVRDTQIVRPTATQVLQRTPDARLTLVTCYPFYYLGSAPKRFIVQADLVGRTPLQTAGKSPANAPITP